MIVKTTASAATVLAIGLSLVSTQVRGHCEIPCGIYTDSLRIEMILEDCQTIEKSMTQIVALSAKEARDNNQLIRWVSNKDNHATKIQHIVTQYFLTQRIKPGDDMDAYHKKLELLHGMLVEAMKCKQTTDVTHVHQLRSYVESFKIAYFGSGESKEDKKTGHEGHNHP